MLRRLLFHQPTTITRLSRPILLPSPFIFSNIHRSFASKKKNSSKSQDVSATEFDSNHFIHPMQRQVDKLKSEFAAMVIGRANPGKYATWVLIIPVILDRVMVSYQAKVVPLNNMAQVGVKDGQTLIVHVMDEAFTQAVTQSIRNAGLGLNPKQVDSTVLHVVIPRMSKDTKDAMIKDIQHMAERHRRLVRDVRQYTRTELKKSGLPKDDIQQWEKKVQYHVDQCIAQIDHLVSAKIKQLE